MVSRILQVAGSSSRLVSRLRRRSNGQEEAGGGSVRISSPEPAAGRPLQADGAALVLDDVAAIGAGNPSPSSTARSAVSPSSGASVGSVGSSASALSLSTASTSERCECEHHSHEHHSHEHHSHGHHSHGHHSLEHHLHAQHSHAQHSHAHSLARTQQPHALGAAPVPAPPAAPASLQRSACQESRHGQCDDSEEDRVEGCSLDAKIEKRRSMRDAKTASGMSQQDLRATIREVQMDSSLSATEKSKKIQEIMSFSWKQSQQEMRPKRSGSTTSASFKRRAGSASAVGVGNGNGVGSSSSSSSSSMRSSNQEGSGRSRRSASSRTARMAEVDAAALSGVDYVSVEDDFEDDLDLGDGEGEGEGEDEMEVDSGPHGAAGETESEAEAVVTYHDRAAGVLGCEHYERKCHVSAPCCNEFFGCRFCHDEAQDHAIDRYSIDRVRCMACGLAQPFAAQCSGCSTQFARYHCDVCRFFDDKEGKKIYHCDKCKICRIGEGLGADYFHCDRCNACMSITLRDHKCVERSLESDCPVCSEYLFTSTTPVMFLVCGHCIHVKCYEHYTQTNFTCPLCCKSLGDMSQYFNRIDQMLAFERMPDEYQGWRSLIFCSDCEQRSTVPYHYVYHKCAAGTCGSYNTKVMQTFASQAEADAAGAGGATGEAGGATGAQAGRAGRAAPQPQAGPRSPATSMGSPHSAPSSSSSASPPRWR
jgi:hypothetical protein